MPPKTFKIARLGHTDNNLPGVRSLPILIQMSHVRVSRDQLSAQPNVTKRKCRK